MASVPTATKRYTVDDLAEFPDDGRLRELVDGRIEEWGVTTYRHGFVLALLTTLLMSHIRSKRLGQVTSADNLVRIQGSAHNARGADVAFFSRARLPRDIDASATTTAPDFVIEVLSPSDRASAVEDKIADWLRAEVRLLWYVNPETGTTMVYQGDRVTRVGPDQVLDGGDVVPGFQLKMRELLDEFEEAVTE